MMSNGNSKLKGLIGTLLIPGFVVLFLATGCGDSKKKTAEAQGEESREADPNNPYPFKVGEKITYAVKKIGVKAGEVVLVYKGLTEIQNKPARLVIFTATGPNFFDEEKIYMHPETFYPIVVERDLNIWGKKEKISEEYDSEKGQVKITKTAGGKKTGQVLQKKGQLDNIYCFIYRSRARGEFKVGESFEISLPTQDIVIQLEKMTTIKAAGENYEAYYMKSEPSKYQVWFEAGQKKIPLRINGAVGFGDTAMIMVEYKEK